MSPTTYLLFPTRLGEMLAAASETGVTGLYFDGQKYCAEIGPRWTLDTRHPLLVRVRDQVCEYLDGARQTFDVPLDLQGTAFQQRVWQALLGIPFGATTTYGTLADGLRARSAVRAVGAAVGRNPVSLIVPCHRVLGTDGSLTGYAGGLERKRALLDLERGLAADPASGRLF